MLRMNSGFACERFVQHDPGRPKILLSSLSPRSTEVNLELKLIRYALKPSNRFATAARTAATRLFKWNLKILTVYTLGVRVVTDLFRLRRIQHQRGVLLKRGADGNQIDACIYRRRSSIRVIQCAAD